MGVIMQVYKVGDKEYRVICAVHNEIIVMISELDIDEKTKNTIHRLLNIANSMAVNMENALERKKDFGIGLFGFNNEDEDDS
jgi:hypothetical protein